MNSVRLFFKECSNGAEKIMGTIDLRNVAQMPVRDGQNPARSISMEATMRLLVTPATFVPDATGATTGDSWTGDVSLSVIDSPSRTVEIVDLAYRELWMKFQDSPAMLQLMGRVKKGRQANASTAIRRSDGVKSNGLSMTLGGVLYSVEGGIGDDTTFASPDGSVPAAPLQARGSFVVSKFKEGVIGVKEGVIGRMDHEPVPAPPYASMAYPVYATDGNSYFNHRWYRDLPVVVSAGDSAPAAGNP